MHLIERPAPFNTIAPLRVDPCPQAQIERFVGTKRWRQRARAMGTPQALEDHAGHGFPRGALVWLIRNETCVDPTDQSYIFYHRGNKPAVIQAFNTDGFHLGPSP